MSAQTGKGDVLHTAKLLGANAIVEDPFDGERMPKAVEKLLGDT